MKKIRPRVIVGGSILAAALITMTVSALAMRGVSKAIKNIDLSDLKL